MIKIRNLTVHDTRVYKATDADHRREAEKQLEEALFRITVDTQAQAYVEADDCWQRYPTWSAADISTARIIAEVAMRHPGIVVTHIGSSDFKYPMSNEEGLVISIWPNGYLCYTKGDQLSFRTGYDGNFPEHLRGTVSVTVGDNIQAAFATLMPRLDALREWAEERVRQIRDKRAAEEAEHAKQEASGEAMGRHIAHLIMSGDALALADAVNAATRAMAQGDIRQATHHVEHMSFIQRMTGMPSLAMGMRHPAFELE